MSRLLVIPAAGIAIGILVLLTVTVQNAAAEINTAQTQVKNTAFMLEKKINDKKVMTQSITDMQQKIDATEQTYQVFTNALKSLNRTGNLMNTDIKKTVGGVVSGISLGSLVHAGGQISINGKADSEQPVLQYVRNLDTTQRFAQITINSIKVIGTDNQTTVNYSLTCLLKGDRN